VCRRAARASPLTRAGRPGLLALDLVRARATTVEIPSFRNWLSSGSRLALVCQTIARRQKDECQTEPSFVFRSFSLAFVWRVPTPDIIRCWARARPRPRAGGLDSQSLESGVHPTEAERGESFWNATVRSTFVCFPSPPTRTQQRMRFVCRTCPPPLTIPVGGGQTKQNVKANERPCVLRTTQNKSRTKRPFGRGRVGSAARRRGGPRAPAAGKRTKTGGHTPRAQEQKRGDTRRGRGPRPPGATRHPRAPRRKNGDVGRPGSAVGPAAVQCGRPLGGAPARPLPKKKAWLCVVLRAPRG